MSYKAIKESYKSMYVAENRKAESEKQKALISAQPTIDVDGKLKQRQNSLGQDIHPTEEGIKNFHRWFGDSLVTEDPQASWHKKEQLRPLVLYHGTRHDFGSFRPSGIGNVSHTFGGYETERHGIFLTPHHEFAQQFAHQGEHESGQHVMPVYAKMHNYLDVSNGFDDEDIEHLSKHGVNERMMRNIHPSRVWELFDGDDGKHFTDAVKAAGFDGVRMSEDDHETGEARDVYVAFHPHQIKSAIGNSGAFRHPTKITESAYDSIATSYIQMIQSKE